MSEGENGQKPEGILAPAEDKEKNELSQLSPGEKFKLLEKEREEARRKIEEIYRQLEGKEKELFPGMKEIARVVREVNRISGVHSAYSGISAELEEFLTSGVIKKYDSHFLISDQPDQSYRTIAHLGSEEMIDEVPVKILDGVYSREEHIEVVFSPAAVERLRAILELNKISLDDYGNLVDPNKEKIKNPV